MKEKSKRINIRLTEDEYQMIITKAKHYRSISSFMIDACSKFDDRLGVRNIEFLMNYCSIYSEKKSTVNKVASNINQIAHYSNILRQNGIMSENLVKEFIAELDKWNECLSELIVLNSRVESTLRKL